MAFLFQKFQEAVKTLAKNPAFARDPRQLQFEVDINRLFLYTSYNRLGKNADEADAEEIIAIASKASVADQQMQVQENVHSQIKAFCTFMDEVLLPNEKMVNGPFELSHQANILPHCTGLSSPNGYLDEKNPYLITRYDGTVIDAQPWGCGSDEQELWNGRKMVENKPDMEGAEKGSDSQSKPLEGSQVDTNDDVLERRNPLALGHFSNHPAKGMLPNVMICHYDFPLIENNMRVYIPNILFGNAEVNMKRFGSFWFQSGVSRKSESHVPTLRTVVLVATRALQDEELLLNYRLSNSKPWPEWYAPVDDEEDVRI
ncbi:uncharacterized protein LOC133306392 isoform X4 [Gastrolobium bilobum]|uniref:uncharacterized protein LOC133306392 isoform X4 n=1 Tax=Gastrolobium bilobum TaxID=150636 RepID=UPI002AB30073|nr:uncharacterized protein LOC133306392 isoform X4 [Gastrolobium bilobum]